MTEQELIGKIRLHLDRGDKQMDERLTKRLDAARKLALSHYVEPVAQRVTGFAVVDGWLSQCWHGHTRQVLASMLLLLGVCGVGYWYQAEQPEDDIDAVLLADELPVQAYVDHGFDKWLKR